MAFAAEKPGWLGYPMVKNISEIRLLVLTQFTNVTDTHTHTQTDTA